MNKFKISKGLASLILLGCMFAGWETLLIAVALILIFCDIEDIKGIMTKILTFYVGLALFTMMWGLIVDGYSTLYASIQGIQGTIEGIISKSIDMSGLYKYFLTPLKSIIGVLDIIIKYLIVVVKFIFIIGILTNKKGKENFFSKFINKYINMALNFVNNIN